MMQYPGLMDWKYLELQAQYLRLLADMYGEGGGEMTATSVARQQVPATPPAQSMQVPATVVSNPPVVEVARLPSPPLAQIQPKVQPPKAILSFSPPRATPQPSAEVTIKRKVTDFDEMPVGGAGRDFNAIMEQALREDKTEAVRSFESSRPREFLKKKARPMSAARTRPVQQETIEEPARRSETPKKLQCEFLRRGNGQLCVNPKLRKSDSKDSVEDSFVSQKSLQTAPRPASRQRTAPARPKPKPSSSTEDDFEMLKRLKRQVEDLTRSKKELMQDVKGVRLEEEALMEEVEEMKREMEEMRTDLEEKKREEIAKMQKERRAVMSAGQGKQVDVTETLKAQVKEMTEAAQQQEIAYKAAIDDLKASLRKAKITPPKTPLSSKPPDIPVPKPPISKASISTSSRQPLSSKPSYKAVETPIPAPIIDTSLEEAEATVSPTDSPHNFREEDVALVDLPLDTSKLVTSNPTPDGKVQKTYSSGRKEILFPDGIRKEIFPDGLTAVHFTNSDVKQTLPSGVMIYYFAETQTTQASYPDGVQKFKFPNGQIEKHLQDGTKEVSFPDGTVKCIFPDGEEESIFPDGTVQKRDANGVKYIDFVSGQQDIIYPDGRKVRRMVDGSVKNYPADSSLVS